MKNYTFKALVSIFVIILVAVILAVLFLGNKTALAPVMNGTAGTSTDTGINTNTDNGAATSTSTTNNTAIFGKGAVGDLNNDDKKDGAYIFSQNTGGSGTFFYVIAELAVSADNIIHTNSILLGDRIAPQNISITADGKVVVNYADRKPSEPMTTAPSVGVTKYFVIQSGKLVEVSAGTTATTTSGTQKTPIIKPTPTKPISTNAGDRCMASGGTWSAQYSECGGINNATCENIGGTFEECASPCRHDPNAMVCVAMCAQICIIK